VQRASTMRTRTRRRSSKRGTIGDDEYSHGSSYSEASDEDQEAEQEMSPSEIEEGGAGDYETFTDSYNSGRSSVGSTTSGGRTTRGSAAARSSPLPKSAVSKQDRQRMTRQRAEKQLREMVDVVQREDRRRRFATVEDDEALVDEAETESETSPAAANSDTSDEEEPIVPVKMEFPSDSPLPSPLPAPLPPMTTNDVVTARGSKRTSSEASSSTGRAPINVTPSITPMLAPNEPSKQPEELISPPPLTVEPAFDITTTTTIHGLPVHSLPPVHSAAVLAEAVQRTLNNAPPELTADSAQQRAKAILDASLKTSMTAATTALVGPAGLLAAGKNLNDGGKSTSSASLGSTGAEPIDSNSMDAIGWESVGGLAEHIQTLHEMIVLPLLHPEIFERFNISPPRGVLFTGPPGTGKTLTARALAGVCSKLLTRADPNAPPKRVSFFMRKGADCLSKWVGEAERQLRVLFEEARRLQPSIIFFDEIDGLAPVRSARQDQIHASIVSTLLAMMDGLDSRGQVIVIGATNRVDAIDPALRRPGRFDRELLFTLPTVKGREQILKIHTRGWHPPVSPELIAELARRTAGYCGADLRALCTDASTRAVRRAFPASSSPFASDGKQTVPLDLSKVRVTREDFFDALEVIVPASARTGASPAVSLEVDTPDGISSSLTPVLHRPLKFDQKELPPDVTSELSTAEQRKRQRGVIAKPLLVDTLEILKKIVTAHLFPCGVPPKGKTEPMRVSGDQVQPSQPPLRPRLLLHGKHGCGQNLVAAALLRELEEYPVFSLHLPQLLSDLSARSPEEACVSIFTEATRNAPSVIYWPSCDTWWYASPQPLRVVLSMLLGDLAAGGKPIFLLGYSDTPFAYLPEDLQSLFASATGSTIDRSVSQTGTEKVSEAAQNFELLCENNVVQNADFGQIAMGSQADPLGSDLVKVFSRQKLTHPFDFYYSASSEAGSTTSLVANVEPFVKFCARATDFFVPIIEAIIAPTRRPKPGSTTQAVGQSNSQPAVLASNSGSVDVDAENRMTAEPKEANVSLNSADSTSNDRAQVDIVRLRDEQILLLHLRLVLRSICSHLCRFYRDFIEEPLHDSAYRSTGDDIFLVDISMKINSNSYLCVREFLHDIDRIVNATKMRLDMHTAHGRGLLNRAYSMQDTALTMCLAIDRDLALACEVMALNRRAKPKPSVSTSMQPSTLCRTSASATDQVQESASSSEEQSSDEVSSSSSKLSLSHFSNFRVNIPTFSKQAWDTMLAQMDLLAAAPEQVIVLESIVSQAYTLIASWLRSEASVLTAMGEAQANNPDRTELIQQLTELFQIRLKEMWRRSVAFDTATSDETESKAPSPDLVDLDTYCKSLLKYYDADVAMGRSLREKPSKIFRLELLQELEPVRQ